MYNIYDIRGANGIMCRKVYFLLSFIAYIGKSHPLIVSLRKAAGKLRLKNLLPSMVRSNVEIRGWGRVILAFIISPTAAGDLLIWIRLILGLSTFNT